MDDNLLILTSFGSGFFAIVLFNLNEFSCYNIKRFVANDHTMELISNLR